MNSASTPLDQDLSQNTSPRVPTYGGRYTLALWIFALAIMSFGGQIYSEITGDWFPTFIHSTAGYPYVYWGYLTAAISILGAIFFLIFGAVSDNLRTRYGRRIPLIVLGGITTAILTALFVISTNYLWLFVNYGILTAVTYNLVRGSSSPLTADLIPLDKRGRVNTLLTVMTNVASAVVWIPALILLPGNATSFPPDTVRLFVYVGAAVFGISMVVGALLIKEPPVLEPPRGWVVDLKSTLDWQEMKKQKSFLLILLANFFLQAASSAIFNYLFVFIQKINFNFDLPTLIGAAIVGVALVTGIYLLGKSIDTIGRKFVVILGFICAPIGSWIIALSDGNLLMLLIGFGVFFPFFLGGSTAVTAWQQDILPKEARGRFFGLLNISASAGVAVGTIISGALADKFSIFWIFVAAALILWISLPFFLVIPETLVKKKQKIDTPLTE